MKEGGSSCIRCLHTCYTTPIPAISRENIVWEISIKCTGPKPLSFHNTNKYIYIVLHDCIKWCKFLNVYIYTILHDYVKQCKKCDFYLRRRGDFITFLMKSQLNGPLQKKILKKWSKNMHPQFINMTSQESMVIKGI